MYSWSNDCCPSELWQLSRKSARTFGKVSQTSCRVWHCRARYVDFYRSKHLFVNAGQSLSFLLTHSWIEVSRLRELGSHLSSSTLVERYRVFSLRYSPLHCLKRIWAGLEIWGCFGARPFDLSCIRSLCGWLTEMFWGMLVGDLFGWNSRLTFNGFVFALNRSAS